MINLDDHKKIEAPIAFFEEFSRIPHGSGNTALIADYLVDFAKSRGLEYHRDSHDNVIIRKRATQGYENRPAIIFQGHLDMVAEKKNSADIDMEKEGLTLYRDGDLLRAKDTTLGGDDGVALAYALAVLDSDTIEHPDFEAVFTSDEEIGLLGATALDGSLVKGRMLINIDSDAEGIFTVGCAGGMRSDISLPVRRSAEEGDEYTLRLFGFKGGHSGVEIDKGRGNAIKALAEIAASLGDVSIKSITGGNADNAIPREAECVLISRENILKRAADKYAEIVKRYEKSEGDINIDISKTQTEGVGLSYESTKTLLSLINTLPSGIISMSSDIEGLVETSLNLGILRLSAESAELSFSVRSSKGTEKEALAERLREISVNHGANYSERGRYPAWEYRRDSHLRDVMCEVYKKMYGRDPEVVTIHAGLECGILGEKLPGLDSVSIGPDNFDIHTTEERLSLSSFERVWEFLIEVLRSV